MYPLNFNNNRVLGLNWDLDVERVLATSRYVCLMQMILITSGWVRLNYFTRISQGIGAAVGPLVK